jgi:hypothetical protein
VVEVVVGAAVVVVVVVVVVAAGQLISAHVCPPYHVQVPPVSQYPTQLRSVISSLQKVPNNVSAQQAPVGEAVVDVVVEVVVEVVVDVVVEVVVEVVVADVHGVTLRSPAK